MDEAYRILEWIRQNDYSLTWVAEQIGFSPEALTRALETNRISHQLADALYEHFGTRIIAAGTLPVPGDIKDGALQVWRHELRRRRIDLKSRAIDLERHREEMKRSSDECDQNET